MLFVLAMLTHTAADPAFTTSGTGDLLGNKVGHLGARVSDVALFLLGFSAWWLVPVALRAWLAGAQVARTRKTPLPHQTAALDHILAAFVACADDAAGLDSAAGPDV